MSKGRGLRIVISIGSVLATGAASSDAAEVRYSVTALGQFTPAGMNDLGQAVGYIGRRGRPRLPPGCAMAPLPCLRAPRGFE